MVSLIQRVIGKLEKIGFRKSGQKSWQDLEYFNESWKDRIKIMAEFMPEDAQTVIDLGCGRMWLKDYLKKGCVYYGVDYKYRGEGCQVYDLNNDEFPDQKVDVIFISGCLEYINDPKALIKKVAKSCKYCIISYCVLDFFSNISQRRELAWVNDLTEKELIEIFKTNNMVLANTAKTITENRIYFFENV